MCYGSRCDQWTQCLLNIYGPGVFKHCIAVFTFANVRLYDLEGSDIKEIRKEYISYIDEILEKVRKDLANLNVEDVNPLSIFSKADFNDQNTLPVIPAGFRPEDQVLSGVELHGNGWIDELKYTMIRKSMGNEPFYLSRIYSMLNTGASFLASLTKEVTHPFTAVTADNAVSSVLPSPLP